MIPVLDFHADLLCYLAGNDSRTPYDEASRASLTSMKKGGVKEQILPIFVDGKERTLSFGMKQFELFFPLLEQKEIKLHYSFENASAFSEESELLKDTFKRLEEIIARKKPIYISFTWNGENRFGGGAHTTVGLKEDGKELLRWLSDKKIAFDFSHTSDALAYNVLDLIHKENLKIPIIASHSNFRDICNVARNLPLEIVKEIVKREGVIGVNFVRYFIGEDPSYFFKQIEYALEHGFINHLVLGADFFYEGDLPSTDKKTGEEIYFPHFDTSACYPYFFSNLKNLGLDEAFFKKISYDTGKKFLERIEVL